MICPICKIENDDNWYITVDEEIKGGGCQGCWEAECDERWWNTVKLLGYCMEEK